MTASRYRIRYRPQDSDLFPWFYCGADDNEARDYGSRETFALALESVQVDDRAWMECEAGRHPWILTSTGRTVCTHCSEEWNADRGQTPRAIFRSSAQTPGTPGHPERSGQQVDVVRPLGAADQVDVEEVGPMFRVKFPDGTEADAFADELHAA